MQGTEMRDIPKTQKREQFEVAPQLDTQHPTVAERKDSEYIETLAAMSKLNIILLGIPGAGKTTLANNLSTINPDVNYISVGEISRSLPADSEQRKYLDQLFQAGSPVGIPEFFLDLIEPYVDACASKGEGFILDGIPKKHEEMQPLMTFMKNKGITIDMAVSCEVDPLHAYERVSERGPRHNDNDSMEVFANRTKIYLENLSIFKNTLQNEGAQLVTIDTTKLNESECAEHFIAAVQLTRGESRQPEEIDFTEMISILTEAISAHDKTKIAVLLARHFDDTFTDIEDYSSIICDTPEMTRAYLEQKFLARDPLLAHTPYFLDKTVQNYLDTTLNSIFHVSQSLLDETAALAEEADPETIRNLVLEQLATRELLKNLQESMVDGRNFQDVINEEISLNSPDLEHTVRYLEDIADRYGVNKQLLTVDSIMKTQPELWGMLTSRRLLRATDTNYRRMANGVADSHHSLLPYNSTPRAMLANSMSNYLPFIEAISSSEYKYSSTFGFVHLIGMDDQGEAYSVEYPLMMYDRRLTTIGSSVLDETLEQIDSIYSNHDLWHNLIPVYADHFILHHPDAPLSYGGRRDEYLQFGKLMRSQKEEYEIGVAMAHAKTQQEQFAGNPILKDTQVGIVRSILSGSHELYNDLTAKGVSSTEAIDIVDFTVTKAIARLYNVLPPTDEIYHELGEHMKQLQLPKVVVDISDVAKILLQQGLVDRNALAVGQSTLTNEDITADRALCIQVIKQARPDMPHREPDAEYIYEALRDIGIIDMAENSTIELDGLEKVRWVAMKAPQREQLKGHMEKVHAKMGQFRLGADAAIADVRELIVMQQEALNKDAAHYLYRTSARKDNQRLSYETYSILFDDNQSTMAQARTELHELIYSGDAATQALGAKIASEIDSIIESLSSSSYAHTPDRIKEFQEIAIYLEAADYRNLALALTQVSQKYLALHLNEARYQASLGTDYPNAAKNILNDQMSIA